MIRHAMVVGCLSGVFCSLGHAIDFESRVAPILIRHCIECHNAIDRSGGLDLTQASGVLAGGDSGPIYHADAPDDSSIVARVARQEMPPEKNGLLQSIPETELQPLREWVRSGAPWPAGRVLDPYEQTNEKRGGRDWWSLQPIVVRPLPSEHATLGPIDGWIEHQLRMQQRTMAPVADRRTLIRRLHADLIGLPPSAAEVDAFESDPDLLAYERLVDRLLASPHFGERWGRHWLDLVRFAETNGYERDAVKPNAWRYRDWVIDAFNEDLPFDRFLLEQLAGDELPDRTERSVIATGFLRLGTWDDEPNDVFEYQFDRLEEMVHATTTAFLGLTVKCARCHDHKFDPIPQTDYYRIASAFWGGPVAHRNREWNGGPTSDELGFDVLGWTDLEREPVPLPLLKKGDPHRPGPTVPPGPLSAVPEMDIPFEPAPPESKTAHRRWQLAKWMIDRHNPLTSRVIVNRLWLHHLGQGLVRTPDNFGYLGQRPTHPELLDYLAHELMSHGWSLKRIHKQIVMSRAYQQQSTHPQQRTYEADDASNLSWWRFQRRRLDAESIRDAILVASGRLDQSRGGPSFYAPISSEALEGLSTKSSAYPSSPPDAIRRRSIYMFTKRSLMVPMMSVFDCCDTTAPTGRRESTVVAPQALTLLNDRWVYDECKVMASRVIASQSSNDARIVEAWRMILGRSPDAEELKIALGYIETHSATEAQPQSILQTWTALCHTLVNTNEFVYVD